MRAAIIGGNLQGIEAAYLSQKAGWHVTVIDRKQVVPAAGLCHRFVQADVRSEKEINRVLQNADLVIPALENDETLECLRRWSRHADILCLFDPKAHKLTRSKIRSNRLLAQLNIPMPRSFPACGFPVIVKPSAGSGSRGIAVFSDSKTLKRFQATESTDHVIQEFLTGPSYSIEIIGLPGKYRSLQVTDLQMDTAFDCKRVLAPTDLPSSHVVELGKIAETIADAIDLKGLMDVEVILNGDVLKVLEIDARLPSQTPTTVFWSTGINMLQMWTNLPTDKNAFEKSAIRFQKGVVYEHIQFSNGALSSAGEHILSGMDPVFVKKDFFGADEAITNHADYRKDWVATLIFCAETRIEAWEKRQAAISEIRRIRA